MWCKFPYHDNLAVTKKRPALVLAVSISKHAVKVAYGTSQKTNSIYPGEFVIDPSDLCFSLSGLEVRTKFDLVRTANLPFTEDWFETSPNLTPLLPAPKMGTLHPSYLGAARAALSKARSTAKDS